MKKQLIAVAVAGAIAAPVMAQNVTVYGTLDSSIVKLDTGASGSSRTYVDSSTFGTSNLGLKGVEDLGGGLKASFDLQGDLFVDDGGVGSASAARTGNTTTTAGSVMFNRAAFVAVEGSFGKVSVGRFADATDAYHNTAAFGINQFNQVPGSSAGGKNMNTLGWNSPKLMGGLVVRLERSLGSTTEDETAGESKFTQHQTIGLEYTSGPLTLRAAAASDPYASCSISSGGSATAGGCKDNNSVIAATYDFGIATVAAVMMTDKSVARSTSAKNTDNVSTAIGVSIPRGALTIIGNYQKIDTKASNNFTTSAVTAYLDNDDASSLGVGVRYALSKRTSLNAMYFKLNNDNNAKYGRAATNGSDVTATSVGVTHSF